MPMNTLERLKLYLETKNIPVGKAERECEFGNATLRNAFESGKGIGSDKIEKILSVYQDLSAEWLFRGTDKMLRDEDEKSNEYYEMCKMILENKKQENDLYTKIASMLGE